MIGTHPSRSRDAWRIAASVDAYTEAAVYSVLSGLRRAAQYTVTQTKRTVSGETGVPQGRIKARIQAYKKHSYQSTRLLDRVVFRAWMGNKRMVSADVSARSRRIAKRGGAFRIPGRRGLWIRKGEERYPIERAGIRLEQWAPDLERHGSVAFRTIYPAKVRDELRRRARRARSTAEAKYLLRTAQQLNQAIQRERVIGNGDL